MIKITIFIAGIAILSNIIGYLGDRVVPLNIWRENANRQYQALLENRKELTAIAMGNSHSESIDFKTMGVNGQILARAAMDLFEMERYIDCILGDLPQVRTVYICISYFSFHWDNSLTRDGKILRIELYATLPLWNQPIAGDYGNFFLGVLHKYSRIMSVVRPDNWHYVLVTVMRSENHMKNQTSAAAQILNDQRTCQHFDHQQLDSIALEIAGKHAKRVTQMTNRRPDLPAKSSEALDRIIAKLQKKKIRAILFTPPYYSTYTKEFSHRAPRPVTRMKEYVNEFAQKYHIAYYDFSNDADFINRYDLFLNSDHLNDCGREAFSERLQTYEK